TDSGLALNAQELANPSVRQIAVANPNTYLGHLTRQALTNLRYLPNHDATPLGQPSAPVANATPTGSPSMPNLNSLISGQTTNLEPKLLVLASEKEVLEAVEDGRAQVGITYASYVVNNKKVRILGPLEYGTYEPVAYNVAIPRNAPHNDEAWQFLSYLRSAEAHAIMQRAGLLVN
ncbi:MAG TPA: extracellular solute-binding protein, partial [Verrucomicrobiae bacterium]|nr:extracellular solute-binding protein [Verrucomicrobiae bacterium]